MFKEHGAFLGLGEVTKGKTVSNFSELSKAKTYFPMSIAFARNDAELLGMDLASLFLSRFFF